MIKIKPFFPKATKEKYTETVDNVGDNNFHRQHNSSQHLRQNISK